MHLSENEEQFDGVTLPVQEDGFDKGSVRFCPNITRDIKQSTL